MSSCFVTLSRSPSPPCLSTKCLSWFSFFGSSLHIVQRGPFPPLSTHISYCLWPQKQKQRQLPSPVFTYLDPWRDAYWLCLAVSSPCRQSPMDRGLGHHNLGKYPSLRPAASEAIWLTVSSKPIGWGRGNYVIERGVLDRHKQCISMKLKQLKGIWTGREGGLKARKIYK